MLRVSITHRCAHICVCVCVKYTHERTGCSATRTTRTRWAILRAKMNREREIEFCHTGARFRENRVSPRSGHARVLVRSG